jgi:LysM repeat protein
VAPNTGAMEGAARRAARYCRATRVTLIAWLCAAVCAPQALADGTPLDKPNEFAAPLAKPSELAAPSSSTHQPYTARAGDTMWSVARRNGVGVGALAGASGRSVSAPLVVGAQLRIPPPGASAGVNGRLPFSLQMPIYSPRGPAFLVPNAARAWEAMRQASVRELGIDLYPFGPDSAYRSYGKQVESWRIFRAGGPEAAPPGTSAHGLGKAVDLASLEMRRAIDVLGPRFGWAKTEAPTEWNHVNYVGG